MILIKEATITRTMKSQEWSNGITPAALTRLRKEGKVPCYYGRVRGTCSKTGYFYDMKFLQEFFKMEFDIDKMYPEYYARVHDPSKEGFNYVPPKTRVKEISDLVSSAPV